jgi:formylmethanofuran dehydrogenase subunit B
VIVTDAERTATADRANLFVRVAPEAQFETLWTLRALVRGVALDPGRVVRATGLDLSALADLANRLKGSRYGALFFGASLGRTRGESVHVEAALALVRDLTAQMRRVRAGSPHGMTRSRCSA